MRPPRPTDSLRADGSDTHAGRRPHGAGGALSGRVADTGQRRPGIDEVSELGRRAFVARFGGVFEHSPWVAEKAWSAGPFAARAELHAAMVAAVDAAPPERRLALVRAHPDLAGRAAIAGALTPASTAEQAAAGLDRLTPAQHAELTARNAAYTERFGFPFVICAREHDADGIIAAVAARSAHDPATEEHAALAEIAKIAALRLADLVAEDPP